MPASASEYTAIDRIPRRLVVRMIRRAISPRLAMSSESIMGTFLLSAFESERRGIPQQRGAAPAVHLTAEERRRVHQTERGMREHPRLGGFQTRAQRGEHAHPLLHVQALQAADLPARLL